MAILRFDKLTEDLVFLFTLCYDNNLNFNRLYRLYDLSDKVFWGYLSSLAPIFKIGVKKVTMYKDTAHNIMNYVNNVPFIELNDFEKNIYKLMVLFIDTIFVSPSFLAIRTEEDIVKNKVVVYRNKDNGSYLERAIYSANDLDDIDEILIKDKEFYKMSKIEYFINKYFGNLKVSDLDCKCLRDIQDMLEDLQAGRSK